MGIANRYDSPVHRQWDHLGNLIPNVEHSEKGPHGRLAGDFVAANWLPVEFYDKHFEAWLTVAPGKIVALTTEAESIKSKVGDWEDAAHVVPAGLKVLWAGAPATALTYTANDVTEMVTDLVTGLPVTAAVSYSHAQVLAGLKSRGLLPDAATSAADFISYPLGVAAHAFYSNSRHNGSKTDATQLKNHNFSLQHQVQILVSYQLRLPWIPSDEVTEAIPASLTASAPVLGTLGLHSAANAKTLTRYASISNSDFLALALSNYPLAGPTFLKTLSCSSSGVLNRLVSGPESLSAVGDYWVDGDAGIILFYVSGGAAIPAALTGNILYYHFGDAASTLSFYASVVSDTTALQNGDFLVCDAESNFAKDTAPTTYDPYRLGQAFGFKTYPKDLVHRVKSQYENLGVTNRAAGTATRGLPETLTFAGGADKEVLVSLINR